MRLIPVIPFFAINSVMGLTSIRTVHFFFVSQLGMLPGTIVYINAGMQITRIDSLNTILSPTLLLSFVLVGLFPLFAKKSIELISEKGIGQWAVDLLGTSAVPSIYSSNAGLRLSRT